MNWRWINEWTQISGSYNWIEMTPIKFYMERDMYWGSFDIDFILLGLGFSVSWEWKSDKTKTPQWRFDKRIAALIKESNAKVAKNKKSKKKK